MVDFARQVNNGGSRDLVANGGADAQLAVPVVSPAHGLTPAGDCADMSPAKREACDVRRHPLDLRWRHDPTTSADIDAQLSLVAIAPTSDRAAGKSGAEEISQQLVFRVYEMLTDSQLYDFGESIRCRALRKMLAEPSTPASTASAAEHTARTALGQDKFLQLQR